jgi:uncharacterized protein (TIRG00374 family)
VRAALVLGTNLLVGGAVLAWVLHRFGGPALQILATQPSLPLLAAFAAAAAATVLVLAGRWRLLLAGLGPPFPLAALALYRSAAHSVALLVPSAKLGGDPLRAWLAARARVPAGDAIASVAVDRAVELGASAPFSILFTTLLVQHGVPGLQHAFVTVVVGACGLAAGIAIAARRLRRGTGLATALARGTRLDRLRVVQGRMDVIEASESAAARLVGERRRMLGAFALGLGSNLLVIAEYALLLPAFGLPSDPIAVVAAIFAAGAAHMLPVPAGIGVLEGAQIWIFGMLGHPADVGLAVGLAVRLRELAWMLPGLLYLLARSIGTSLARGSTA